MKHKTPAPAFVVLCMVLWISGYSQSIQTLVFNSSTTDVRDAPISSLYPDTNYGQSVEINVYAWTVQGEQIVNRVLVDFDLSAIPEESLILDAKLTMYYKPKPDGTLTAHSGENNYLVQRIISDWVEETVTWNNQPSVTFQNVVEVPPSTDPHQNAVIDVTDLVQDMIDDPENSFGFMLRLVNEAPYRLNLYGSSDHWDISVHPQLIVSYLTFTYTQEVDLANSILVYPNPGPSFVNIENKGETPISRIIVRNVWGQAVRELAGNTSRLQMGEAGTYFLEIFTEKGVITKQIIIQ